MTEKEDIQQLSVNFYPKVSLYFGSVVFKFGTADMQKAIIPVLVERSKSLRKFSSFDVCGSAVFGGNNSQIIWNKENVELKNMLFVQNRGCKQLIFECENHGLDDKEKYVVSPITSEVNYLFWDRVRNYPYYTQKSQTFSICTNEFQVPNSHIILSCQENDNDNNDIFLLKNNYRDIKEENIILSSDFKFIYAIKRKSKKQTQIYEQNFVSFYQIGQNISFGVKFADLIPFFSKNTCDSDNLVEVVDNFNK